MAVGAPDFFGQSVWPSYGSLLTLTVGLTDIPSFEYAIIGRIVVQGIIAAALINFDTLDPTQIYPRLIVDDEVFISDYKIADYRDLGFIPPARLPLVVVYQNSLLGRYTLSTGIELPFRHSFEVGAENYGAELCSAWLNLYYYNII